MPTTQQRRGRQRRTRLRRSSRSPWRPTTGFDSDPDALLDATVARHKDLVRRAKKENAAVRPKVLYVVESSNPRKGEMVARPVAIWEYLREKRIAADEIAVYTQTKVLPDEAERVSSLSDLEAHHRHIICNRALQEGWDDPEAYVEYFDDESTATRASRRSLAERSASRARSTSQTRR